jgi:hypothetical protein
MNDSTGGKATISGGKVWLECRKAGSGYHQSVTLDSFKVVMVVSLLAVETCVDEAVHVV